MTTVSTNWSSGEKKNHMQAFHMTHPHREMRQHERQEQRWLHHESWVLMSNNTNRITKPESDDLSVLGSCGCFSTKILKFVQDTSHLHVHFRSIKWSAFQLLAQREAYQAYFLIAWKLVSIKLSNPRKTQHAHKHKKNFRAGSCIPYDNGISTLLDNMSDVFPNLCWDLSLFAILLLECEFTFDCVYAEKTMH